jgi:hypothetical protein
MVSPRALALCSIVDLFSPLTKSHASNAMHLVATINEIIGIENMIRMSYEFSNINGLYAGRATGAA